MLEWLPNTGCMEPDDYFFSAVEVTEEGLLRWKKVEANHYKAVHGTLAFVLHGDIFECFKQERSLIKLKLHKEFKDQLESTIHRSNQ